jgi:hypothetical protein
MQRGLVVTLSALALMFCAATQLKAADKANVTGTWVISQQGRNGNTSETTLKLKQDGEKVTGTLTPAARAARGGQGGQGGDNGNGGTARPARAMEIEDGKITDSGELTFKVSRENAQGNKMVSTYHGKVEGDTIKGTVESEGRNGQSRSRDFEAKRKADEKGGDKSEK